MSGDVATREQQGATSTRAGLPVLTSSLRRERRGLAVWAVGVAAVAVLYSAAYITVRSDPALAEVKARSLGRFGEAIGMNDLTSPAGYLDATIFGLLGPLLLIMFAIITAGRAIAGDDEQGTLDLYLAQPVSRTRYLVERTAAIVVQVMVLAAVVGAAVIGVVVAANLAVPVPRLVLATVGLALLALDVGAVAILVGTLTGRRAVAVGAASAFALAAYLTHVFAQMISGLHGMRVVSPFWWYVGHHPSAVGLGAWQVLALAGVAVVLFALAVPAFSRRDVGV